MAKPMRAPTPDYSQAMKSPVTLKTVAEVRDAIAVASRHFTPQQEQAICQSNREDLSLKEQGIFDLYQRLKELNKRSEVPYYDWDNDMRV